MPNLAPKSARALTREAARERREQKREHRRNVLDLVVAGYAYEQIADQGEVSVATIRREKGHDIEAACGQLRLQATRDKSFAENVDTR